MPDSIFPNGCPILRGESCPKVTEAYAVVQSLTQSIAVQAIKLDQVHAVILEVKALSQNTNGRVDELEKEQARQEGRRQGQDTLIKMGLGLATLATALAGVVAAWVALGG